MGFRLPLGQSLPWVAPEDVGHHSFDGDPFAAQDALPAKSGKAAIAKAGKNCPREAR